MKKILVSILAIVLIAASCLTIFAACEDPVDYEKTIVFYSTQGDNLQAVTQNAINAFQEKYPGWTVQHIKPGGYDDVRDKIVSDLQGGVQPDLAYCYPDHVALYIQTQKVVDMNKYLKSTEQVNGQTVGFTDEEIADFVTSYYNEGFATEFGNAAEYGYADTAMLTLPFVKSTELLYYNKTALDACNLEPAKTWDELWAQADTLSKAYPSATLLGYDSEANWFITMCEQNGWGYTSATGNNYLFNGEEQAAWLNTLSEKFDAGQLTTQNIYGSYTSALFTKGVDGGIIYCVGSSGGASHQKSSSFEVGIAPVPGSKQADGSINATAISQGPSLVMLTGGNDVSNPDEKEKMTFLFLRELLATEFQAAFSEASGYISCRKSTATNPMYAQFLATAETDIVAKAATIATEMMLDDIFFTSPAFVGSSTARDQVGNALKYAVEGTKSGEKALSDAYKHCGGK